MKRKLLRYSSIFGFGVMLSGIASAGWVSYEVPGLVTFEMSTGSQIGSFVANQIAIGNVQTAIGTPTIKTPGFVIEGKATNTINSIKIRGSQIGSFVANQIAIGNVQTAIGNASNSINTIQID